MTATKHATEREMPTWHALKLDTVKAELGVVETGLTLDMVQHRREVYGPNRLPRHKPTPVWRIILRQFKSPLIYILGVAAVFSVAIGETTDALFIVAVLVLNGGIGTYQEWRAERQMQALQRLLSIRATVDRNGERIEIDAQDLVPGDIVHLDAGNRVPADIRLITAQGLQVDESLLTGESTTVAKDPQWIGDAQTSVGDRLNVCFAGAIVAAGRAKGICVATGSDTMVGQLARDVMGRVAGKPPLVHRMERFSRMIAVAVVVAAIVVGVMGVGLGRYGVIEMLLLAVALCVSAIPEGLPVSMTVALSVATMRMARRGVIVRTLTTVEGLGSCTLIATDKTGTLTINQMTVRRIALPDGTRLETTGVGFSPEGFIGPAHDDLRPSESQAVEIATVQQQAAQGDERDTAVATGAAIVAGEIDTLDRLARAGVLCNDASLHYADGNWIPRGDPVDVALLVLAEKLGANRREILDSFPKIAEIPFESANQFAATFRKTPSGAVMVVVKGAPEKIAQMCDGDADGTIAARIGEAAEEFATQGFRVLAVAQGMVENPPSGEDGTTPDEPRGLEFLGLIGMIDPLRPEVREAVLACHDAGVGVTMITGDHKATALAIAQSLGIAEHASQVITGRELQQLSDSELLDHIKKTRVFARISPQQKFQLVEAARKVGHFVAVTGDGVNDAPALRTANIGIAMGKSGTDVARESSGLIITDDNFATIVAGIEEGRLAYDNIRKVIFLLVSTGAAEIVLLAGAILLGTPLPLLPVQILWLNLVTNGIQDKALAFEPKEGGELQRDPRRPNEPIFNRLMIERVVIAGIWIGGVSMATFVWLLDNGWGETEARNLVLLLMVLFENVHLFNARSEVRSALRQNPLRNLLVPIFVALALGVHVLAMYTDFGTQIIAAQPVGGPEWMVMILLALTILPVMELHKFSWYLRTGSYYWTWPEHRAAAAAAAEAESTLGPTLPDRTQKPAA